jgi:hypothetical protein
MRTGKLRQPASAPLKQAKAQIELESREIPQGDSLHN